MEVFLFLLKLLGSTFSLVILLAIGVFYMAIVSPAIDNKFISTLLLLALFWLTQSFLSPLFAKLFVNNDIDFLNKFFMFIGLLATISVIILLSLHH